MGTQSTKERLLHTGVRLMLERGYNDTGIQDILEATGVPKGSFYHHFDSKEDYGLRVVDLYAEESHERLDAILSDGTRRPLERIRRFFDVSAGEYRAQGCRLGCLLGTLGQELAGINEAFRRRIDRHLEGMAEQFAACLAEARDAGELSPGMDPDELAEVLVASWEGAILRMRVLRSTAPLDAFIRFYFGAVAAA